MKSIKRILAVLAAASALTVSSVPTYASSDEIGDTVSESVLITDIEAIQQGFEDHFEALGIEIEAGITTTLDNKPLWVDFVYYDHKLQAEAQAFAEEQGYDPSLIQWTNGTSWGAVLTAEKVNALAEENDIDVCAYGVDTFYPEHDNWEICEGKTHIFYYDDEAADAMRELAKEYIHDPDILEYVKAERPAGEKITDIFEICRTLRWYVGKHGNNDKVVFENTALDRNNNGIGDAPIVHMYLYDYSHPHTYSQYEIASAVDHSSFREVMDLVKNNFDRRNLKITVIDAFNYETIYKLNPEGDAGDVNGDGSVNARDCAYIAKVLAMGKGAELPEIGDYNYDGKVDIRDAALIALSLVDRSPGMQVTQSCVSELKISGKTATCSSVVRGYQGKTKKIIINQTLQKKNSKGKWTTVAAWSSTVRGYTGSVKKIQKSLQKGTYRLKTTFTSYSSSDHESGTKYSSEQKVK